MPHATNMGSTGELGLRVSVHLVVSCLTIAPRGRASVLETRPATKLSENPMFRQHVANHCQSLITVISLALVWNFQVYAANSADLPELGDDSARVISATEEQKLGRRFIREARKKLPFVSDPELNHYLTSLGKRLAAHSDAPQSSFKFFLVRDPQLNAFAVPGGYIAVHTGLMLATEHESEFAAVLAHEIAHITQRHLPRMLARSKQQSIPAMAAIAAAILLGGQAGTAALAATNAAIAEDQLTYSRNFEEEADAIGIRTLARANMDPRAMPAFFERMQRWSRIYESDVPEFLRTHPLTYKRIAESQARAESYPPAPAHSEDDFLHMREKVRVMFSGRSVAIEAASSELPSEGNDDHLAQYGMALANVISRRFDAARDQFDALTVKFPARLSYRIAQAENEMAAAQFDRALEIYGNALESYPSDSPLPHYYASALVRTGHPEQAKTLLRKEIRKDSADPTLYEMLARAEGDLGASFESHQALAEFHYLRGETKQALEELRIALEYADDSFYAKASAEARIKEIEAEAALYDEG